MGNFLSTALGQGEYKKDETETLKMKVPESTTSIPMELIKLIDTREAQYYGELKAKESEESERFFKLNARIKSFEDYDNEVSSSKEVGIHGVQRLKVAGPSKEKSSVESLKADLSFILKDVAKNVSGMVTLPSSAITSIDDFVDSLTVTLERDKKIQNSDLEEVENLNFGAGLSEEVMDQLQTKLLEFKDKGYLTEAQFEELNAKFKNLEDVSSEVKSLAKTPDVEVEGEVKELAKGEEVKPTEEDIKLDIPPEVEGTPSLPKVPSGENRNDTLDGLTQLDVSSSSIMNKSELETPTLDANKFPSMETKEYRPTIAYTTWEFEPLSGALLSELAKSLNLNPTRVQQMQVAADTLAKRFAINDLISRKTGITYQDYEEVLDYIEIAKKIKTATNNDGVVEISTENLIFAATFAAFLDPLTIKAPTTRDRGLRFGGKYKRGLVGLIPTGGDIDADRAKKKEEKVSFYHTENIENLPFTGRKSVEGIELFNTAHWDIKFSPITVGDLAGNANPNLITKVPLPRYSKDWWIDQEEVPEVDNSKWLPINSFNINLTNPIYESFDPYGMMPIQMFSGISYPMSGSFEFMETESLWLRNWMRDYMAACYEDDGVTCKFTYHEMSFKAIFYIWDAMDIIKDKPKVYDRLYTENGKKGIAKRGDNDSNTPQFSDGNFIRKYTLYILPQVQGEQWTGTPGPTLLDKLTLNFSIVGGEGTSLMALDDKYRERYEHYFKH